MTIGTNLRSSAGGRAPLVGLLALAICCALSVWASFFVVDRIYAGELLPNLFTNRGSKPVEHYYAVVIRLILAGYLIVGLLWALFVVRPYRSGWLTFAVLAGGDILFCVLSEVYGGWLSVRVDGGIPEGYQYFKEVALAIMMVRLYRVTGSRVFLAWSALFAFLFVDDAFRFHERMGVWLAGLPGIGALAAAIDVRAVDIAELVSVAPILGLILLTIVVQYWRERPPIKRSVSVLVMLFVTLLFFGGVMDIIDRVAVTRAAGLVQILSLIEDGGEMLTMSAMFAYSAALLWRFGRGDVRPDSV